MKKTVEAIIVTPVKSQSENSERAAEASGFRAKLNFSFIFHLCLFTRLLKECKSLSDFLQGKDCDIVAAINLVETTRDLFNQMRESDTGFTSVWKESIDVATKIGADIPTDSSTLGRI